MILNTRQRVYAAAGRGLHSLYAGYAAGRINNRSEPYSSGRQDKIIKSVPEVHHVLLGKKPEGPENCN